MQSGYAPTLIQRWTKVDALWDILYIAGFVI